MKTNLMKLKESLKDLFATAPIFVELMNEYIDSFLANVDKNYGQEEYDLLTKNIQIRIARINQTEREKALKKFIFERVIIPIMQSVLDDENRNQNGNENKI